MLKIEWGTDDIVEGTECFDTEEAARSMLLHDTDATNEDIDELFRLGVWEDLAQWVRVERIPE